MRAFDYIAPGTLEEALEALRREGSCALAGGTDLMGAMKRGTSAPRLLVDLKSVPGLAGIRREPDGFLSIGALTVLDEVAGDALVAAHCPLLVLAIEQAATPQIRNVGTLGGNLCQRPRCWYFRHPDFSCLHRSGKECFAVSGQNRYHAIFGGRGCFITHPSDTAPALIALDARVRIAGHDGSRELPLAEFFVGPDQDPTRETILNADQILTQIRIPPPPAGARGLYLKASERRSADFALASAAVLLAWQSGQITHARIVLGGVAPIPWRVPRAEAIIRDEGPGEAAIRRACEAAAEDARPMSRNAYKVPLVKGLLGKALRLLTQEATQKR